MTAPRELNSPSTVWSRARQVLVAVLGVEMVVLAVTGIALYFMYRPTASQSWADIYDLQSNSEVSSSIRWSSRLRVLHRATSVLAFPTAFATGLVLVVGDHPPYRRVTGISRAVVIIALAPVIAVTGYLLPWDQVALWAVTVGTNLDGFGFLRDDSVRFVIIGGVEVSPDTIIRWLVVHVALSLALAGLVAAAWRAVRRARI